MLFNTTRFGEIEYDPSKKLTFKEGIPGFETLKDYILLEDEDIDSPFKYLQSTQDPDICFVIMDPYALKKDYSPTIKESYFEMLGGGSTESFSLFIIANIRSDLEQSTVNLTAPLLIHLETRLGVQVILESGDYTTKHSILTLMKERG